ncbi:MAG: formylmethanofuran dehydrogenase subunit E family protein [Candidatus Omnitrophica bacterium]|nr:formylmethanofuran dehydrogenase subunit E family protein [Candidatus Omnitrophota bacterium]
MSDNRITLKEAERFHGHVGPYLILGILAGELAINKLNFKRYFDLEVKVSGVDKKPKSCIIDGLQLSTGATYGKGNIYKMPGRRLGILFTERKSGRKIKLNIKGDLIKRIYALKGHFDSERLARELYKTNPLKIFDIKIL